jgi:hypothetical protein
MANDALKIVTQENVDQAKWSLGRIPTAPEDSSKLMQMLGDIEGLRREIQERVRRIDAVKQAKSLLVEEAVRTEALNQRLAEIGKEVTTARPVVRGVESDIHEKAPLRRESAPVLMVHEGVALPWPKAEDAAKSAGMISASDQRGVPAEIAEQFAVSKAGQEIGGAVALTGVSATDDEADHKSRAALDRAGELVLEARRLFEESSARLNLAVQREQQAAADFESAQRSLNAAREATNQRLAAAERFAKEGDASVAQTQKLLARIEAELAEARSGGITAAEDLRSARQELTTAYQFASVAAQRRLDSARFYQKVTSWVVFSTALAWLLAVWMAWLALNRTLSVAIPFAASCLILAGAFLLRKRVVQDLEEN